MARATHRALPSSRSGRPGVEGSDDFLPPPGVPDVREDVIPIGRRLPGEPIRGRGALWRERRPVEGGCGDGWAARAREVGGTGGAGRSLWKLTRLAAQRGPGHDFQLSKAGSRDVEVQFFGLLERRQITLALPTSV